MSAVAPRRVAPLVAIGAMVPVSLYILDRRAWVVGLSLVSVLLIAASVYLLFGPAAETHGGHEGDAPESDDPHA